MENFQKQFLFELHTLLL